MGLIVLVPLLFAAAVSRRGMPPQFVPDILSSVGETDDFEPSHPTPVRAKKHAPTEPDVVPTKKKKATLRKTKTTRGKTTLSPTTEEETTTLAATTTEEETTRAVLTAAPSTEAVATPSERPVQEVPPSPPATTAPLTKIVVVGDGSVTKQPNQMTLRVRVRTIGGATTRDTRETHTKVGDCGVCGCFVLAA